MKKFIFLFFCLFSIILKAENSLVIVYEERIPYVEKDSNSVKGLVATPAIKALNKAKIDYILKEKPSKRHLYEIKANIIPMCALGWFKNKKREIYSKFTLPLYQDNPLGIVSRIEFDKLLTDINVDKLLKSKLSILTKASYSYGNFIDKKIEKYKTKKKEVYANNKKMLNLIEKKRADFMFISKEEANLLLKKNNYPNLKFYKINNIPKGNKRYLICSKKVSDNLINKININLKQIKWFLDY